MKKILLILFLINTFLFSQGASIYSNFGIGELNLNPTVRRSAFGLGIAGSDNFDVNPFNPASSSKIPFVKFSGALNYSLNNYSDKQTSNNFRTGSFEYLLITIPIQRDYGIVLNGGISPFTKVNYKVLSPQNYFDSIPYQVKYEGLGGITNYFVSVSYNAKNIGSFGLSTNFLIGTITNKISTEFLNTNYINPTFTTLSNYKGTTFRIGYISENLKSLFENLPFKEIKIGLSYLNSTSLKLEQTHLKQGIFIDTTAESSNKIKLPGQFTAGISAKFSHRLTGYLDYLFQDWTKLNTYSQSNYSNVAQNYLSIGFEYLPTTRPEKYFDAISWRFGLFTKNLGLSVNNQKINEYGLKVGASLPIDQLNLIDIGVQYSVRGTKENNLVKESILNFWFGINFAEIWFVRNEE